EDELRPCLRAARAPKTKNLAASRSAHSPMHDPQYLLAVVSLPFFGSIIAAALPQAGRNWASAIAGVIALAGILLVAAFYPAVAGGEVVRHEASWLPSLGLQFTLRLDGFTWLFALLVLTIGALVILYAR